VFCNKVRQEIGMRHLLLLLLVAACAPRITVSEYVSSDAVYVLDRLGGAAFPARATITFPGAGKVLGEAPCNRWSAPQALEYPLVKIGPILSTKRACDAQVQETAYFAALAKMKRVEATGSVVILSDNAGTEMVFRAE